jgi:hypothetical protein
MPVSTILMLITAIGLFALVAISMAWAQLHARHLTIGSAAPEAAHRQRRRPF